MNAEHPDKIYFFTGMQGDETKFERTPLYQAKEELLVAVGQLKKRKVTNLAIPSFFPQDEAKAYTFERSSFITEAEQLAEAQVLLFQIFAEQITGTAEKSLSSACPLSCMPGIISMPPS